MESGFKRHVFFFSPAPFCRRISVLDCCTGQSPGKGNEMTVVLFFFFFLRTFFRVCLWLCMTVLLGSLQAHDWHEGQKSRAQVSLGRGGEATGGRRVWRGFRQELAPVDGIGVDVVEIGCSFTKKGGCEGGHGCMCQRGGPSCGESGRYALLEDGGCLSGSGSCQVGDEGGSLLTPSAPQPLWQARPSG